MKFAFVLTQLEIGGAQVRVFQTAEELRSRGHIVDVMFLYQKRNAFSEQEKLILSHRSGMKALPGASWHLFQKLRDSDYDVLITNTAPANIIGNLAAMLAGLDRRIAVQTQPPQRLNRFYRVLDKIWGTLGIYRYNVANSKWTATCFDKYPASYRKRLHLLVNGIRANVSSLSQDEARIALGLPLAKKIVLNVGRLSEQKDQSTIVSAMRFIPDATLAIVGDGELQEALKRQAANDGVSDRVVFLGELPRASVGHAFRAADVFAFPSRWETFGLAVVEAAASGLPIVAARLPVLEEVLTTQSNIPAAKFVPVGDVETFAREISAVLSDPNLARALRDLSIEAARYHSIEAHVDRIERAVANI